MVRQATRRRDKEATRKRLLEAAAREFNRVGFDGTDSNRLARAAGYAPATFYKHFADKRDCFLQVYESWVAEEWTELSQLLDAGGPPTQLAPALVDAVIARHKKWRGLRGGLRALVAGDQVVRRFQREQRARQLDLLAQRRARGKGGGRTRAEDAVLLLMMERTADALADGEIAAIGVSASAVRTALHRLLLRHLTS